MSLCNRCKDYRALSQYANLVPGKGHTSVDSFYLLSGGTGIGNKPDRGERKYLTCSGIHFLELLMYLEGGI